MASEIKINVRIKYYFLFYFVKKLPFLIGLFWDKKAIEIYVNDKLNHTFTFRDILNY